MPGIIYDVSSAPIEWPWITLMAGIAAILGLMLLSQFLSARLSWLRTVVYASVGVLFVGGAILVGWVGTERRASCIATLENGRAQIIEGRLESFDRILIKNDTSIKETRFVVAGKTFTERNASGQPCGYVRRFTDSPSPMPNSYLKVWFDGNTVLRVEQKR
jgi:hypothetical protein